MDADHSGAEGAGQTPPGDEHDHLPEWGEVMVRSVAHLAAQVTTLQIQLRALGEEAESAGTVDPEAVRLRQRRLAVLQTGPALRENLGAALAELIDTDALERDLVAYLSSPPSDLRG